MFSRKTTLNRKLIKKRSDRAWKHLILLCGMSRKWNFGWNLIITMLKKKKKSHRLIFQWHLIYTLLMLHSSYNRALLGVEAQRINKVAIQIKREMQYYRSNWHINWKTNENPARYPTAKTFIYTIWISTSHLCIEESQRNSKLLIIINADKLWCLLKMLKQFLLPSKFCTDWETHTIFK